MNPHSRFADDNRRNDSPHDEPSKSSHYERTYKIHPGIRDWVREFGLFAEDMKSAAKSLEGAIVAFALVLMAVFHLLLPILEKATSTHAIYHSESSQAIARLESNKPSSPLEPVKENNPRASDTTPVATKPISTASNRPATKKSSDSARARTTISKKSPVLSAHSREQPPEPMQIGVPYM